jgi:diguanylate cyclase (GGDEF)-like protein/PAS domain S-box-containing protein
MVARGLQSVGPAADDERMRSIPSSPPVRPGALEAVLEHVGSLDGSALGGLPGTAAMVLDRDLRVRLMSGPAWEELGIDPATVVGRLLAETSPAATFAIVAPHYEAVLAGEERAFSLTMRGERTHWLTARPVREHDDAPVEGVLAVSWDQTVARRAEDHYRLLAENATDVVTRHDPQGRYLYVSPSMTTIADWTPDDLLGRSCFEFVHPDDADAMIAELAGASLASRLVTIHYRIRRRDGGYVWVESSCRWVPDLDDTGVAEIQCSTRDITARREADAELAQRLAQQQAVARLGELALQRGDTVELQAAACRLITETLGIDLSYSLEHLGDALMRTRAAVGFGEGFVGSEFEVASFRADGFGNFYADGPVVVDDLPSHPMRGAPLRAAGAVSCAHVLIGERGRPLGLLGAHSRAPRAFTAEDLDFLQSVAHVLASALERVQVEERIRHDALHDALTGLPNRTLLVDRLRIALARARRDRSHTAVLFLDLDRLKVVNDSLGHDAGDDLLRAVGPRLSEVLRPSDTVARFGGDEFAVLLQGVDGENGAIAVAERIVGAFDRPFSVAGEPRFGSASVGLVVTGPDGPRSPEELLSDADAAMYRAKERGRGRFELFDAGLRNRITARLRMEADLRRALEGEGRLWVAYQPFWHVPERRIAGVEALLRWEHPERGMISPGDFIPVAEDSGLIVDLGTRVLRAACAQVARWQGDTPFADLRLTVNVSARQVASRDLVATVAGTLRASGLPARSLGLEITEGLLLEETPATGETIRALQDLGVGLILDDFGTGYSSLRYLQRYPLDGLKVDQSFVAGLGPDGDGDSAIVEAIVGMARALGMRIIPEGVETEGQLARLVELGLCQAQGFLLSRPLPAAGLERLLRATSARC